MSFLLKVSRTAFSGDSGLVPRMKSAKLSADDIGKEVFVWLDDGGGQKSGLHAVARLVSIDEVEMPQVRNPNKSKPGYMLKLSDISTNVTLPLTTDNLSDYRYSKGTSGLERLGKIHRDRNDKILSIAPSERDELAARFGFR